MGDTFTFDTSCPGDYLKSSGLTLTLTMDLNKDNSETYKYFNGGLIQSNYGTYYDKDSNSSVKDWTKSGGAQSYLNTLNKLPGTSAELLMLVSTGNGSLTGNVMDANNLITGKQREKDGELLNTQLKKEYCHYKQRYKTLLEAFLNSVKPNPVADVDTTKALEALIEINNRMNAFVLLVKYIGNDRIASVNSYLGALNSTNEEINKSIASLGPTGSILTQNNTILHTRNEMVRYTKEKNNSITNHISLWASLNVVAIAIIFHLYRKM